MKIRIFIWLAIILLLPAMAGCSESEKTAPGAQSDTEQEEDIWATQRRPITRAEALEQQLQEQTDRQRKEIEEQSR